MSIPTGSCRFLEGTTVDRPAMMHDPTDRRSIPHRHARHGFMERVAAERLRVPTRCRFGSKIDLLGHAESVVDLYAEIARRAFQFGVPQQKLDSAQIARLFVYPGRSGPSHGVRSVSRAIESGARDQILRDARVSPGGNVRPCREAARRSSRSYIDRRVCSISSNWSGMPIFIWITTSRSRT
jgi:hypothetical protein